LRAELAKAGFAVDRLAVPALDERFVLTKAGAAAEAGAPRLAPTAASRPDWHNARARLMLDLNARLEALPSDAMREAMLERLSHAVAQGRAVDARQGERSAPTAV
jgi:metallo-beta-lactamase family protein